MCWESRCIVCIVVDCCFFLSLESYFFYFLPHLTHHSFFSTFFLRLHFLWFSLPLSPLSLFPRVSLFFFVIPYYSSPLLFLHAILLFFSLSFLPPFYYTLLSYFFPFPHFALVSSFITIYFIFPLSSLASFLFYIFFTTASSLFLSFLLTFLLISLPLSFIRLPSFLLSSKSLTHYFLFPHFISSPLPCLLLTFSFFSFFDMVFLFFPHSIPLPLTFLPLFLSYSSSFLLPLLHIIFDFPFIHLPVSPSLSPPVFCSSLFSPFLPSCLPTSIPACFCIFMASSIFIFPSPCPLL